MTRSPASGRRHGPWTEAAIRDELRGFLADRTVWPTYNEFDQAGLKAMRDAIIRIHGAEWWAQEMGVLDGNRRTGGVRRWTDEKIRETLRELIGTSTTWPTAREFDAAGLHALREALRHYGGPMRWSRELGVEWTPKSSRPEPARPPAAQSSKASGWPRWTEPTITLALAEFLSGRTDWPSFEEFVSSDRKGLYQAVLKHGGSRLWADRMDVRWVDRRPRAPVYSEQQVREQLSAFLVGRTRWPKNAEFEQAGQGRLLREVRRCGGSKRWADELGLDFPSRVGAWSDETIEAAITPLVRRLGRWPKKSEFREAGLGRALAAVYEHGGSRRWQRRLAVEPSGWPRQVPDRRRWNEERVEAELRALCQSCQGWPSLSEFKRLGSAGLYSAISRQGGVRAWRQRMNLD